jgi:hypothetical protein
VVLEAEVLVEEVLVEAAEALGDLVEAAEAEAVPVAAGRVVDGVD